MSKWYEESVFYHIYPLGMTGAPKKNEGPGGAGRFQELNRWIPHIAALGCSALYIGPLFESSSHGYDTADYRMVDRRLGVNEDFRAFTDACHEAGIRVVADGVFNHTGREFFAFRDILENKRTSPYCSWYRGVNFDRQSPLGDGFAYEAWQGHFELPCLNLSNPDVRNYLFDSIRFWIDEFHIDGIRLDCANVLNFDFMKELRRETEKMKEDFWLMGEVIHGEYSRWVNDEVLHSVTNYELHKSIYSSHNDHNYFETAHNVRRLEAVAPRLYTFVDNHDEDRIASKLLDKRHLRCVYQLLFTLPGIPSVYYGSEWGIEGRRTNTSDEALRPRITMEDEPALHCKLTDFISCLSGIHREHKAFHGGRYQELLLTNRQYAFARINGNDIVLSAVNNDEKEAAVKIPCLFPGKTAVDLLTGREQEITGGIIETVLPAGGGAVLEIREG